MNNDLACKPTEKIQVSLNDCKNLTSNLAQYPTTKRSVKSGLSVYGFVACEHLEKCTTYQEITALAAVEGYTTSDTDCTLADITTVYE